MPEGTRMGMAVAGNAAAAGAPPPSLQSLCLELIAAHLTVAEAAGAGAGAGRAGPRGGRFDEVPEKESHLTAEVVAEALPWELLQRLAPRLPPFALESLHHAAHARCCSCTSVGTGGLGGDRRGIKRSRCEDFNSAWQEKFILRWPLNDNVGHDCSISVDWQQQYWEKHLQECLDETAETALLPSFYGIIGELSISSKIMTYVYHTDGISQQYSRLSHQCSRLGCYARCLRLQNVLCTAEICGMLQHSTLETLIFIRIISESEVNGVCLLLTRHAKTMLSLEFVHCQLSPAVMDRIFNILCQHEPVNHEIKFLSIKSSRIRETKPLSVSTGLLNFLSCGKSLQLLSLNDAKLQPSFAKMIMDSLLESSCGLQSLEISENDISGWLASGDISLTSLSSGLEPTKSLNSLTVLNVRGNNFQKSDVEDLCNILAKIPNLRSLDISDNPITDEGIRYLISFFEQAVQTENSLWKLRADNCDLSSIGVIKLLECLTSIKKPLDVLSIADNHLGSAVAAALAKFLGSCVRELNVEDIDLGPLGFQILEEALPQKVSLTHINISKNRGGIRTAHFISKLILQAPSLFSVNVGSNLLPPESLEVIYNVLKQTTCNLVRLDLMGNVHLSSAIFPAVMEFKKNGKPIVVVPSRPGACAPHDDDP